MHATSAHAHLRKKRIILRKMKRNHTNKIVRGQFEKRIFGIRAKKKNHFREKKCIWKERKRFGELVV